MNYESSISFVICPLSVVTLFVVKAAIHLPRMGNLENAQHRTPLNFHLSQRGSHMHNALKLPDVTLFRFFFPISAISFKTKPRRSTWHARCSREACTKTRNNETKPPKRAKRNHRNKRNDLRNEQNKKKIRQHEYDTKRPTQNHGPAKDRIIFYLRL